MSDNAMSILSFRETLLVETKNLGKRGKPTSIHALECLVE